MHKQIKSKKTWSAKLLVLGIIAVSNASPAWGGNMIFGGVLPGGGLIQKNIISMREAKYEDMVPQRTDFSCGAAAIATILKYAYNQEITEDEVIEGLMKVSDLETVRQKGFSLLDMKRYSESIGMRARGYKVESSTLDKIRIPIIVLIDYKGYKHFVVVKKATPDQVYVADPALGNRIIKRQDFDASWNGIVFALIGQGFDRNTVLLQPKEAVTARSLGNNTFKPLTDAELFDYGFIRADLLSF